MRQPCPNDVLAQKGLRRELVQLVEQLDALLVSLGVLHREVAPDLLAHYL